MFYSSDITGFERDALGNVSSFEEGIKLIEGAVSPSMRHVNFEELAVFYKQFTAPKSSMVKWSRFDQIGVTPLDPVQAGPKLPSADLVQVRTGDISRFYVRKLRLRQRVRDNDERRGRVLDHLEPALPLVTEFFPSHELLGLWISGIQSYLDEAIPSVDERRQLLKLQSNRRLLSQEFSRTIYQCIIQYAVMKSYDYTQFRICLNSRMVVSLQGHILSQFFIRPDEGSEFFALLVKELLNFLHRGNRFEGGWGKLVLDGPEDMALLLQRPRKYKTRGFRPSDEE